MVSEVVEQFGRLDGVANCIGSLLLKPAHLTSFEDWDVVIRTNLTSAFAVVASAAKAMRQRGGSIVLVSSAAAGSVWPIMRPSLPRKRALSA